MSHVRSSRSAALLCAALSACMPRNIPPPAEPPRADLRETPPRPPTADEGTLTLDVIDGRARAELVVERQQADPAAGVWMNGYGRTWNLGVVSPGMTLRSLCQTPCAVNLPRGDHSVLFSDLNPSSGRTSVAMVRVGERPSVARHAMGRQTHDVGALLGGVLLAGLGGVAMLGGGILLGFGEGSDGSDLRPAGGIVLGVGTVLTVVGTILGLQGRPTLQPGSTTQWTP